MIKLPPDFLDFIRLLNEHGVEYLIVGGYAVAVHGYVRYTGDIDFFIAINPLNAARMVTVFNHFGLRQQDINTDLFMDPGKILRIGSEPMRLEVLNQISGVQFDACYKNRKTLEIEGVPVHFLGYSELIKNKQSTGRDKDTADVVELKKRND